MSGTGEFEAHALAAKFPTMDDKDFAALVADIKANGQREPIVIFQGKILDGRHRAQVLRAVHCYEAGMVAIQGQRYQRARTDTTLEATKRNGWREAS